VREAEKDRLGEGSKKDFSRKCMRRSSCVSSCWVKPSRVAYSKLSGGGSSRSLCSLGAQSYGSKRLQMDHKNIPLYYASIRGIASQKSIEKEERRKPLAPSYIQARLGEDEEVAYKAAGVMPIAFFAEPPGSKEKEKEGDKRSTPFVLLGTENRLWELTERKREARGDLLPYFLNVLGRVPHFPNHISHHLCITSKAGREKGLIRMQQQLGCESS